MTTDFHSIEFHLKGRSEEVWSYCPAPGSPVIYRPNAGEKIRLPMSVRKANDLPEVLQVVEVEHCFFEVNLINEVVYQHYIVVHCVDSLDEGDRP